MGCIICENKEVQTLVKEDKYQYGMCTHCGHIQQKNIKDDEHYHKLPYESQWDDYNTHSKNRAYYVYEFCNNIAVNNMCDVGCGWGGPLHYMKKVFKAKYALGITADSKTDKRTTKWNKDLTIYFKDFMKWQPNIKFEFATMIHVLEHFTDPKSALIKFRSILKVGGMAYIEVPSFDWVSVRTNPWYCPVHISYFSKDLLCKLLQESGFELIKCHESKYWGNIKVLVKASSLPIASYVKKGEKNKLRNWNFKKKYIHPIYRLLSKIKNIKPNE